MAAKGKSTKSFLIREELDGDVRHVIRMDHSRRMIAQGEETC